MAIRTLRDLWRGSFDTENPWVQRIAALRGSLMDRSPLLALKWTLAPFAAVLGAAMLGVPHAFPVASGAVLYGSLMIAFMAPARGIGARRRYMDSPLRDEARLTLLGHGEALAGMHARVLLGTLHALAFALLAGIFFVHGMLLDGAGAWRSDLGLLVAMTPFGHPGLRWEPELLPWMAATVTVFALAFASGYYLRAALLAALPHRGPVPVVVSCALIAATMGAFHVRVTFTYDFWDATVEPGLELWPAPPLMCVVEGAWALLCLTAALAIWKWLLAHPEKLGYRED